MKKKPIPKKIRQLVWNKHIGEDKGVSLCLCCQSTKITQMDFHCGHIISEVNGGDTTILNLLPICSLCNSSMGRSNLHEFQLKHGLNSNSNSNSNSISKNKKKNKCIIN